MKQQTGISFDEQMMDQLRQYAESTERTISGVVRLAVREFFKRMEQHS